MPELPEVEVVRRGVERWVAGRTVESATVLHPRAARRHAEGPADLAARMTGRSVSGACRRGKYLWLPIDGEDTALVAHLGMSGQLLVTTAGAPDGPHLHVRMRFAAALPQPAPASQKTDVIVVPTGGAGRIERGLAMNATAYKRVELLRTRMWRDMAALFANYDALLCPTCAVTAPLVTECDDDYVATGPDGRFVGLDMTCPFNMLPQLPALSLPVGLASNGLPVGLQIVGRRFADESVLSMAAALEARLSVPRLPAP